MRLASLLGAGLLISATAFSFANEKKKPILPATILNARTVSVIVDPDAGVSSDAPLANKTAVEDVERAFSNWGRFKPVLSGMAPDLVVVIRRGNGKMVQPTVHGGTSPNDRPVVIQPNDKGIRIGGQKGRPPGDPQDDPQASGTGPGVGIGGSEDSFFVFDGTATDPTSSAPMWRYVGKNALHSHDVPAVGEFRKIVEETEKQLQKQQGQKQQQQNKP
ncbi:MAG: hypothetical protein JSS69_13430 [Acidobacteria bacterium]|nr:hypothetical protein [Acidobacteriota bacterium]MBS1866911.1 hypothetical protein [Acidobacteriota bacterium]